MANNENNPKLKIISDCFIKPKFDVNQSKTPHYLSSNDLFQLSTSYMHRGLLYAKPASSLSLSLSFIDSFVDNLKQSISLALVDFYPLSGRLETVKYPDDHSSWVYVNCNTGLGSRFIHATTMEGCNLRISNIVTCYESISRFMWSLFDAGELNVVNHDGHSRALLSIQVTDLVDGVFIGFTMNHSVGDGMSLWCFINALSKIFMNQMSSNNNIDVNNNVEKPVFKGVFSDGYGPIIKHPYMDPSEFITRLEVDPRLRLRIFHFSAGSIATLKAQTNEKSDNVKISSFQALAAFVWISITRARNQPDDSSTNCWLTADTRPKHDPILSPNHFGNFVHLIRVTSKVNDLMSNGLGRASMLLHKEVMGLDNQVIRANLKARDETPQVAQLTQISKYFGDNPPLIFTGSMRFDAYGPEFGLGKAVATRPGYSTWMNGRIVVDPGYEGGGSVDLHVCLLSEIMDVLEFDNEFMSYVS
ncbi:hypothetical protein RND81_10G240600 [Saponaria officinalis]|uniref:Uncharacterized protein n=1 Tax=Saponaria officinalis TaxID=3572 RepID=A0AAW1I7V2_SAPOF